LPVLALRGIIGVAKIPISIEIVSVPGDFLSLRTRNYMRKETYSLTKGGRE